MKNFLLALVGLFILLLGNLGPITEPLITMILCFGGGFMLGWFGTSFVLEDILKLK